MNKVPPIGAHVEYVRAVRSYVSGRIDVRGPDGRVISDSFAPQVRFLRPIKKHRRGG
jgi:hypothetical protein